MPHAWLMKAEPESRVVNGVDVAFSADTFERVRTSAWEGVRNYQARNYLRDQMHVGDQVLFYHSNCHVPGVVALAHVCKEGYPDPTAFDPQHPYYDAKSSKDAPRWFMVDVEFDRRLRHPVPLALLQHITSNLAPGQREDIAYLTDAHIDALSTMPLLHRSRLSIQPVESTAHDAIVLLGERGGFASWPGKWAPAPPHSDTTHRATKRRRTARHIHVPDQR